MVFLVRRARKNALMDPRHASLEGVGRPRCEIDERGISHCLAQSGLFLAASSLSESQSKLRIPPVFMPRGVNDSISKPAATDYVCVICDYCTTCTHPAFDSRSCQFTGTSSV